MRQPNYKLGWYIPNQIAALTHFHSDVTQEDFMGVLQTGEALLKDVDSPFHVIIDNRVVSMAVPASLSQMKEMVSFMNHPLLRWVVVVKPARLDLDTSRLPIEQIEKTQLKNVSSLPEAIVHLRAVTNDIMWETAVATFSPKA